MLGDLTCDAQKSCVLSEHLDVPQMLAAHCTGLQEPRPAFATITYCILFTTGHRSSLLTARARAICNDVCQVLGSDRAAGPRRFA